MRWAAFLARFSRQRTVTEQTRALDEGLERRLAERKAARPARQERSRKGAATKVRQAVARDPIMAGKVGP